MGCVCIANFMRWREARRFRVSSIALQNVRADQARAARGAIRCPASVRARFHLTEGEGRGRVDGAARSKSAMSSFMLPL